MIIKNLSKGDSGSKIVLAVNHHLFDNYKKNQ